MRSGHAKEGRRRLWAWAGGLGLFVGSALPAAAQYQLPGDGRCS